MPRTSPDVPFRGFIQIELNEDDFRILDATSMPSDECLIHIAAILNQRYRLSVASDTEARRVKISLMDMDSTRTSAGWMLTAESDTFINALLVLFYKHEAKMQSNWVPFCNATRQTAKYR